MAGNTTKTITSTVRREAPSPDRNMENPTVSLDAEPRKQDSPFIAGAQVDTDTEESRMALRNEQRARDSFRASRGVLLDGKVDLLS